jgi:hypothetical protein
MKGELGKFIGRAARVGLLAVLAETGAACASSASSVTTVPEPARASTTTAAPELPKASPLSRKDILTSDGTKVTLLLESPRIIAEITHSETDGYDALGAIDRACVVNDVIAVSDMIPNRYNYADLIVTINNDGTTCFPNIGK